MSKLLLLYSTIILSLVFLLVPTGYKHSFLVSDRVVSLEYYIYSIYEFLILIVLTGIIAKSGTQYKFALWVFFWLMVADLIDWLICYNEVWFYIHNFPVSMNILKCFIFGLTILNAWIRNLSK